jgi:ribosome maturation factor RimP
LIELHIENLLEQKFREPAFSDCFIIDIIADKQQRISVFLDCDSSLTLQKCQKISRYLEEFLDADESIDQKYTLEVSSPGVDRPLKYLRQYYKNKGRLLKVNLTNGEICHGVLKEVEENTITLAPPPAKGKKKKTKKELAQEVDVVIPFDQILETVIEVVF